MTHEENLHRKLSLRRRTLRSRYRPCSRDEQMQLHILYENSFMESICKPSSFRVLSGSDNIKGYHKHPLASLKYFCDVCGVRTHEGGSADYMGGDFVGIYVATLDNAEPEELITAPVHYTDGRHNNWQNPPAETRITAPTAARSDRF